MSTEGDTAHTEKNGGSRGGNYRPATSGSNGSIDSNGSSRPGTSGANGSIGSNGFYHVTYDAFDDSFDDFSPVKKSAQSFRSITQNGHTGVGVALFPGTYSSSSGSGVRGGSVLRGDRLTQQQIAAEQERRRRDYFEIERLMEEAGRAGSASAGASYAPDSTNSVLAQY